MAEDKLWGLRQTGQRLERYVEDFLELANQLSWHNAALGACFQLGLDDVMICCDLPVWEYPLIAVVEVTNYNYSRYLHHAEVQIQNWTCGYGGLCRRFCFDQEYIVGHHGCPRRYRCCAVRF
ncbi:beta-defensin-like 2 isoform X3 [Onychostoma macrolepis]|uniref:beta-defensin-like 2 isoform X3 n=1 Tax=Onychostoma macrolepis TaxID=369639 RepID=UPI00272A4162|nr:beta-defensin-like 2 isoform X3 [Onychostoma macrolepis]XP_058615241.1 beta-defensin-like 2 isoform X3 [Onychostoma macrolepis]